MTSRSRRFGIGIVALMTCALVAGCVTLPDSSGVNEGQSVRPHARDKPILNAPPPPPPGASKGEIVNGYLQAMLAFPQNPTLVREYFTPEAGRSWQPDQLLVVYQDPQIEAARAGKVKLSAQQLGSLDDRGSWVSASAAHDQLSVDLVLLKVDGQWRISNPPTGTLLDTENFERYYHEYSLFFFDPTQTVLAPDPVYQLIGSSSRMASDLVANLLRGPTAAMDGVVGGVVPRTTHLDPGVLVKAAGIADVRLTSQVDELSNKDLELFAAQLSWTLRQELLGIKHIRIIVDGHVIVVPGLSDAFPAQDAFRSFDPSGFPALGNLYAVAHGTLMAVTPTGPSAAAFPVAGPIGTLDEKVVSAAVSLDASRAAVVVRDRTAVVVGHIATGTSVPANRLWFRGAVDLLKPSWDARGLLWLVDNKRGAGAVVRVVTRTGSRVVDAPGIAGQDVRAFAVSRDGMRLAAIIGEGANSRLVIAMVRRSPTSRLDVSTTGLRSVVNAAFPFVNLTSVAWYSPTVVAVLAQVEGSEPQPYQIALDGSRVQPTTGFLPVLPVSLTAGASPTVTPVIGTKDGRLYVRAPNQQWALVPTEHDVQLRAPTYPG